MVLDVSFLGVVRLFCRIGGSWYGSFESPGLGEPQVADFPLGAVEMGSPTLEQTSIAPASFVGLS
jgi:hypothetical protein